MANQPSDKPSISVIERGSSTFATIMLLAWPIIMEQLLMTLVQYADTAMVGILGANATAAVAINTSSINLLNGLCMACGVGFTALVARAIGAGDIPKAKSYVGQAMILVFVIGIGFTVMMCALSPYIPVWMGGEPDIIEDATAYLFIIACGMFFKAAMILIAATLRGAGDTKTPMRINIAINLANIVGNYFFIYETRTISLFGSEMTMWGAGMGVAGAALSTTLSTAVGAAMMFYAIFFRDSHVKVTSDTSFKFNKELMGLTFRISLPTIGERLAMNFGQMMVTYIITSLGTASLAAHHIAITAESICFMPAFAFSSAATTLVGQALGAEREDLADSLSWGVIKIAFSALVVTGTLLFFGGGVLISLFTRDPVVRELATTCLRIVAFAQPFVGLSMSITGILRGAGDTIVPLVVVLISLWCLRIGLAWVLCILMGFGLHALWVCMVMDFVLRSAIFMFRYKSGKWKHVMKRHENQPAVEA